MSFIQWDLEAEDQENLHGLLILVNLNSWIYSVYLRDMCTS